jgi:hypothetical protein
MRLSAGSGRGNFSDIDSAEFTNNVTVIPTPHESSRHGLWAFDNRDGHEAVYGDRD